MFYLTNFPALVNIDFALVAKLTADLALFVVAVLLTGGLK